MKSTKTMSIKEAATLAEKSEKTIRRWLSEITKEESHPHRKDIFPNVDEERAIRNRKDRLVWQISEQRVREQFLGGSKRVWKRTGSQHGGGESETEFLRRQLEEVQSELATEREHNRSMQIENNERQSEFNKTIQGIQYQLLSQHRTAEEGSGVINVDAESVGEDAKEGPKTNRSSIRERLSRWVKSGPAVTFDRESNELRFYIAKG